MAEEVRVTRCLSFYRGMRCVRVEGHTVGPHYNKHIKWTDEEQDVSEVESLRKALEEEKAANLRLHAECGELATDLEAARRRIKELEATIEDLWPLCEVSDDY